MNDKNIFIEKSIVKNTDREKIKNHSGVCIWLTGLSGSGKSTIAKNLELKLNEKNIHTYVLDGDNIRNGINKDLDFTDEARKENVRRVGEICKLFVDAGIIVIAALISPYSKDRNKVKNNFTEEKFIEVFVDTDLEVCMNRDPKGLYKKALKNEVENFTGISSAYEKPKNPDIRINNNDKTSISKNVDEIINFLIEKKIVS